MLQVHKKFKTHTQCHNHSIYGVQFVATNIHTSIQMYTEIANNKI